MSPSSCDNCFISSASTCDKCFISSAFKCNTLCYVHVVLHFVGVQMQHLFHFVGVQMRQHHCSIDAITRRPLSSSHCNFQHVSFMYPRVRAWSRVRVPHPIATLAPYYWPRLFTHIGGGHANPSTCMIAHRQHTMDWLGPRGCIARV